MEYLILLLSFIAKSLKILFTNQAVYDILTKVRLIFSQEDIILDNNQLQKRYGLFTAICMVVGIVIGSGVFFRGSLACYTPWGRKESDMTE